MKLDYNPDCFRIKILTCTLNTLQQCYQKQDCCAISAIKISLPRWNITKPYLVVYRNSAYAFFFLNISPILKALLSSLQFAIKCFQIQTSPFKQFCSMIYIVQSDRLLSSSTIWVSNFRRLQLADRILENIISVLSIKIFFWTW